MGNLLKELKEGCFITFIDGLLYLILVLKQVKLLYPVSVCVSLPYSVWAHCQAPTQLPTPYPLQVNLIHLRDK